MFTEPFYKARTIGDNIDVTFGFIRENIKTVVKTAMLFSIPICVIMEVLYVFNVIEETADYSYNSYADEAYTWGTMDTIIFMGILVNLIIIMPLALSIININYNRKGGTENITMKEAWKYIKPNLGKSIIMPFSQLALCLVPIFIIIAFTGEFRFLTYSFLVFLFFIITANSLPAYCIGKHSYSTSISKGFSYGFSKLFVIIIS